MMKESNNLVLEKAVDALKSLYHGGYSQYFEVSESQTLLSIDHILFSVFSSQNISAKVFDAFVERAFGHNKPNVVSSAEDIVANIVISSKKNMTSTLMVAMRNLKKKKLPPVACRCLSQVIARRPSLIDTDALLKQLPTLVMSTDKNISSSAVDLAVEANKAWPEEFGEAFEKFREKLSPAVRGKLLAAIKPDSETDNETADKQKNYQQQSEYIPDSSFGTAFSDALRDHNRTLLDLLFIDKGASTNHENIISKLRKIDVENKMKEKKWKERQSGINQCNELLLGERTLDCSTQDARFLREAAMKAIADSNVQVAISGLNLLTFLALKLGQKFVTVAKTVQEVVWEKLRDKKSPIVAASTYCLLSFLKIGLSVDDMEEQIQANLKSLSKESRLHTLQLLRVGFSFRAIIQDYLLTAARISVIGKMLLISCNDQVMEVRNVAEMCFGSLIKRLTGPDQRGDEHPALQGILTEIEENNIKGFKRIRNHADGVQNNDDNLLLARTKNLNENTESSDQGAQSKNLAQKTGRLQSSPKQDSTRGVSSGAKNKPGKAPAKEKDPTTEEKSPSDFMTIESAEELISTLPGADLSGMNEPAWAKKCSSLESLTRSLRTVGPACGTFAEALFVYIYTKTNGFKQLNNANILKAVAKLFSVCAVEAGNTDLNIPEELSSDVTESISDQTRDNESVKFPIAVCSAIVKSSLMDRIKEQQTRGGREVFRLLDSMAFSLGLDTVCKKLLNRFQDAKLPAFHIAVNNYFAQTLDKYGSFKLSKEALKRIVERCLAESSGLKSSNVNVKNSAGQLLLTIHSHIGDALVSILESFVDENGDDPKKVSERIMNPMLAKLEDNSSAVEACKDRKAKQPADGGFWLSLADQSSSAVTEGNHTSSKPVSADLQSDFAVDLTSVLTSTLLRDLTCMQNRKEGSEERKAWKLRNEALDKIVNTLQKAAKVGVKQNEGIKTAMKALRDRLRDPNANLRAKAASAIAELARNSGALSSEHTKIVLPDLIPLMNDNKSVIKTAAKDALDSWIFSSTGEISQSSFDKVVPLVCEHVTSTSNKDEVLSWLIGVLQQMLGSEISSTTLKRLVKCSVHCLSERRTSTRKLVSGLLEQLTRLGGDEHISKEMKGLDHAEFNEFKPIVDSALGRDSAIVEPGGEIKTKTDIKPEATLRKRTISRKRQEKPIGKEALKGNTDNQSAVQLLPGKVQGKTERSRRLRQPFRANEEQHVVGVTIEGRIKNEFQEANCSTDSLLQLLFSDSSVNVGAHKDWERAMKAIQDQVCCATEENVSQQEVSNNIDLIFKYCSLRFTSKKTNVIIASQELIKNLLFYVEDLGSPLSEYEVECLLPTLVHIVGHNQKHLRDLFGNLLKRLAFIVIKFDPNFSAVSSQCKHIESVADDESRSLSSPLIHCRDIVTKMMREVAHTPNQRSAADVLFLVAEIVHKRKESAASDVQSTQLSLTKQVGSSKALWQPSIEFLEINSNELRQSVLELWSAAYQALDMDESKVFSLIGGEEKLSSKAKDLMHERFKRLSSVKSSQFSRHQEVTTDQIQQIVRNNISNTQQKSSEEIADRKDAAVAHAHNENDVQDTSDLEAQIEAVNAALNALGNENGFTGSAAESTQPSETHQSGQTKTIPSNELKAAFGSESLPEKETRTTNTLESTAHKGDDYNVNDILCAEDLQKDIHMSEVSTQESPIPEWLEQELNAIREMQSLYSAALEEARQAKRTFVAQGGDAANWTLPADTGRVDMEHRTYKRCALALQRMQQYVDESFEIMRTHGKGRTRDATEENQEQSKSLRYYQAVERASAFINFADTIVRTISCLLTDVFGGPLKPSFNSRTTTVSFRTDGRADELMAVPALSLLMSLTRHKRVAENLQSKTLNGVLLEVMQRTVQGDVDTSVKEQARAVILRVSYRAQQDRVIIALLDALARSGTHMGETHAERGHMQMHPTVQSNFTRLLLRTVAQAAFGRDWQAAGGLGAADVYRALWEQNCRAPNHQSTNAINFFNVESVVRALGSYMEAAQLEMSPEELKENMSEMKSADEPSPLLAACLTLRRLCEFHPRRVLAAVRDSNLNSYQLKEYADYLVDMIYPAENFSSQLPEGDSKGTEGPLEKFREIIATLKESKTSGNEELQDACIEEALNLETQNPNLHATFRDEAQRALGPAGFIEFDVLKTRKKASQLPKSNRKSIGTALGSAKSLLQQHGRSKANNALSPVSEQNAAPGKKSRDDKRRETRGSSDAENSPSSHKETEEKAEGKPSDEVTSRFSSLQRRARLLQT